VNGRCIRQHRLDDANVQLRPCGRLSCLESHREGARLQRRIERLQEVLDRHRRICSTCRASKHCAPLGALLERLRGRQLALASWRALGRRRPLTGAVYAAAS
jgi:hypothetical protein